MAEATGVCHWRKPLADGGWRMAPAPLPDGRGVERDKADGVCHWRMALAEATGGWRMAPARYQSLLSQP